VRGLRDTEGARPDAAIATPAPGRPASGAHGLLALQRSAGNAAVGRVIGARRRLMRQSQTPPGGGIPRRIVYLDANVFTQIIRGNTRAAETLLRLLPTADVRISHWTYRELVVRPGNPRTAAAQRLMIEDLHIHVDPEIPRQRRIDLVMDATPASGRTAVSARDMQLIVGARAGGGAQAEVWSFDEPFRSNPGTVEARGVRVAPESRLPVARGPRDWQRGRALLGLVDPVEISEDGVVRRGPRGGSPGGGGTPGPGGGAAPPAPAPDGPAPRRGPTADAAPDGRMPGRRRPRVRLRGGVIVDLALLGIDLVLGPFERKLDRVTQELFAAKWQNKFDPQLEPLIDERVGPWAADPARRPQEPIYFVVQWKMETVEMNKTAGDAVIWLWRMAGMRPGFVELLHDIHLTTNPFWLYRGQGGWRHRETPRVMEEREVDGETHRTRGIFVTQILISDPEVWKIYDAITAGGFDAHMTGFVWERLSRDQRALLRMLLPDEAAAGERVWQANVQRRLQEAAERRSWRR
jgi:hypothetical protein